MPSVAVYIRVSTTEQNLEGQRLAIKSWLSAHGMEETEWYEDRGESGEKLSRPAFDRLQKDIFLGKIKTVVVYKLDRMSRSLVDGINLINDWVNRGIRIISVTQQIDFSGTVGKMIASVLLALGQMESETRRERQADGIRTAKLKGKYQGGKPGRRKGRVAEVVKLRRQGLTHHQIAQATGLSRHTVMRYIAEYERSSEVTPAI